MILSACSPKKNQSAEHLISYVKVQVIPSQTVQFVQHTNPGDDLYLYESMSAVLQDCFTDNWDLQNTFRRHRRLKQKQWWVKMLASQCQSREWHQIETV